MCIDFFLIILAISCLIAAYIIGGGVSRMSAGEFFSGKYVRRPKVVAFLIFLGVLIAFVQNIILN